MAEDLSLFCYPASSFTKKTVCNKLLISIFFSFHSACLLTPSMLEKSSSKNTFHELSFLCGMFLNQKFGRWSAVSPLLQVILCDQMFYLSNQPLLPIANFRASNAVAHSFCWKLKRDDQKVVVGGSDDRSLLETSALHNNNKHYQAKCLIQINTFWFFFSFVFILICLSVCFWCNLLCFFLFFPLMSL